MNNNFYIEFKWDSSEHENWERSYADKIGYYKYMFNNTILK